MKSTSIILGILMLVATSLCAQEVTHRHQPPINICINNQYGGEPITILAIADALQTQITQDFQQFYLRDRTVTVLPTMSAAGCWPVKIISGPLYVFRRPVEGYHAFKKTPYAIVTITADDIPTSIAISRVVLGMLLDPTAVGTEIYNGVNPQFYAEPPGVEVSDFNIPRRYGASDWCGLPQNVGLCQKENGL
jgi:hypothetical protein